MLRLAKSSRHESLDARTPRLPLRGERWLGRRKSSAAAGTVRLAVEWRDDWAEASVSCRRYLQLLEMLTATAYAAAPPATMTRGRRERRRR